ncbi:hypothetical protein AVEN_53800-1 [Araneus ventricosus]|uniref:ribonuclease H n=1 Tax=Araneus ventricosus TaxID=182803 RepID=A0A4Y2VKF3_ARAVE|nr:hypothetical protein AVEN_53800-1 [Araneus ventricosus]
MLAHGAAAWCLTPTTKLARKLNTIQIPFLLAISGAYRTTSAAALQTILGIPPLSFQLQYEARITTIYRLRNCLPAHVTDITPKDLEEKAIGWTSHPSQHLEINQVNISEDGDLPPQRADVRIFTDGSKTVDGVGAALCVQEQNTWTHNWSAKFNDNSTVFQAELTALKEAVELATQYPPSTSISIHVDNRASFQATSNPKTTSPTARKFFNALLNNTNITLHWIKAHAGHEGNEKADQLAKEASATGNMYDNQKLPKPYIKSILKNKMMQQWQLEWNKSDTGKKIRDILSKVSTHSAN